MRRAIAGLALLALAATLPGCGLRVLQRGERRAAARAERPVPAETVEDARREAALDAAQPYWPYREAQLHLAADSLAAAEAALRAALERDRGYVPALSLLGKLLYDAGRHAEGVALLEAARADLAGLPGGVPAVLTAGLALHHEALGHGEQARELMRAARRPGAGDDGSALAFLVLRGEHPDSAAAPAAAALERDDRSAANHNNYGITRLRAGDVEVARRAFLRAIELDPRRPGPYYNLAILDRYYRFDDPSAARWYRAYRERSAEDPDSLRAVFERGTPADLAGKGD